MNYLITYDISDDKSRTKLSDLLDKYGYRANYSVYECELNKTKLRGLLYQIESQGLIDHKYDSIRFYHICQNCTAKSFEIGRRPEPFEPREMFI